MQFVFVCGFTQFFWIMMYSDPFDQWWIWRGSQLVLQPVLGKILQVTKRHAGHELHQNGPISEDWARFKDCYTIWKVEFRCITCMHGYGKPSSNSQSSFYIGNSWLDEPLTANQSEAITIDPEKTSMARLFPVIPNYGHTWTSVSYPRTLSLYPGENEEDTDVAIAVSRCNRCRMMQFIMLYISNLCETIVNDSECFFV